MYCFPALLGFVCYCTGELVLAQPLDTALAGTAGEKKTCYFFFEIIRCAVFYTRCVRRLCAHDEGGGGQ